MSDVTQKIETPAEKVARLEAELRQAQSEKLSKDSGFSIGETVYIWAEIEEITPNGADHGTFNIRLRSIYNRDPFWLSGGDLCKKNLFKSALEHKIEMKAMEDKIAADFIPRAEHERLVEVKDGAYAERNKLVAALSKLFPASIEQHDGADWEDDWRNVIYIDLPTGQCSWHIHDSELPLFAHLPKDQGRKWDGHTTEQKYERVLALENPATPTTPQDCEQEPVEDDEKYDYQLNRLISNFSTAQWGKDKSAARKAINDYVAKLRRPAPLTEQAKLAAGDCVDYLIKEYALDNPTGGSPRPYTRDHEGIKYTVTVSRTCDNIAAAPAVAPKGVVEEIRECLRLLDAVEPHTLIGECKPCKLYLAALEALGKVTELPEGFDGVKVQEVTLHYAADSKMRISIAHPHILKHLSTILDSALLAAANPAKEGEE